MTSRRCSPVAEGEAQQAVAKLKAQIAEVKLTVNSALTEYEKYMRDEKGNKENSVAQTMIRLRRFFCDADLALVDLGKTWTIDDASLQSLSKISPWHGRAVTGLPIHTLVRGKFVMRDRMLMSDTRGWGRSVHTIQQMPAPVVRNADQTMQSMVKPPLATPGNAA